MTITTPNGKALHSTLMPILTGMTQEGKPFVMEQMFLRDIHKLL